MVSCCAVVRGCMRNVFFVPRPGTFSDDDQELADLEAAALKDPASKGALTRRLHVSPLALAFRLTFSDKANQRRLTFSHRAERNQNWDN